jgi:BlaI family transcriptional regulator, penicillinase repressor
MEKRKSVTLTKFELEIMRVLWDLERASVREIQENLSEKRRPAYTTVQTIVRRLEEKGGVRRLRKIGNALIFEPAITRKAVHGRLITELLQLFGGSARPLMAHLAEMGKLSLEDVRELETLMTGQQENPANSSVAERSRRNDKS